MLTEQQKYQRTADICDEVGRYTNSYIATRGTALLNGDITAATFAADMKTADKKITEASGQLRLIRFPTVRQRSTHRKVVAAFYAYSEALKLAVKAVDNDRWDRVEARVGHSLSLVAEYVAEVNEYIRKETIKCLT